MQRSHLCGDLRLDHRGENITLVGWVNRSRSHGGLIFMDLRDHSGMVQIVVDADQKEIFQTASHCRSEYVIKVQGTVQKRAGAENTELTTGKVEVIARSLDVLNTSSPLPFQLDGPIEAGEDIRLKYRYLELRRPELQKKIIFRAKLTQIIRHYLDDNGFFDIETPVLTRATPEGARDYLVPSRIYPGQFFSLPQSPQLFKQLLMVAGFDRYYQIARCFRDEDLRADRQPEFTQIDMETSFMSEEMIQSHAESMLKKVFLQLLDVTLDDFPRITYAEAMQKYGSDKPDLRIPIELIDIDDLVKSLDFKVFSAHANNESGRVVAMKIPTGAALSRRQIDDYTKFVGIYGAKGLAWMKVNALERSDEGLQSPILKFLGNEVANKIVERVNAQNGDLIFFGADTATVVNEAMGALRCKLGEDLHLYTSEWAPLWVVDFPMFERNTGGDLTALHHPFTAPSCTVDALLNDPENSLSQAYDIVLNGFEIGGGSIRIHEKAMQQAVFSVLAIDENEQQEKFGFLLDALQYGAPPHGGIAFGLDRVAMLMSHASSIREVIAFPKTLSSSCLMTQAPGHVDEVQLHDLNLKVRRDAASATSH